MWQMRPRYKSTVVCMVQLQACNVQYMLDRALVTPSLWWRHLHHAIFLALQGGEGTKSMLRSIPLKARMLAPNGYRRLPRGCTVVIQYAVPHKVLDPTGGHPPKFISSLPAASRRFCHAVSAKPRSYGAVSGTRARTTTDTLDCDKIEGVNTILLPSW